MLARMRRGIVQFGVCCAALLCLLTACTDGDADDQAADGTGFLAVSDLRDPPMPEHFTGKPVPLEGRLVLRPNGCVTVVIGGAERVPLWPAGTEVVQQSVSPDRYTVSLPGGTTMTVDSTTGDSFSAAGIIDDSSAAFEVEAGLPTKVSTFLAFCEVEARPVAFPDVTTFAVR